MNYYLLQDDIDALRIYLQSKIPSLLPERKCSDQEMSERMSKAITEYLESEGFATISRFFNKGEYFVRLYACLTIPDSRLEIFKYRPESGHTIAVNVTLPYNLNNEQMVVEAGNKIIQTQRGGMLKDSLEEAILWDSRKNEVEKALMDCSAKYYRDLNGYVRLIGGGFLRKRLAKRDERFYRKLVDLFNVSDVEPLKLETNTLTESDIENIHRALKYAIEIKVGRLNDYKRVEQWVQRKADGAFSDNEKKVLEVISAGKKRYATFSFDNKYGAVRFAPTINQTGPFICTDVFDIDKGALIPSEHLLHHLNKELARDAEGDFIRQFVERVWRDGGETDRLLKMVDVVRGLEHTSDIHEDLARVLSYLYTWKGSGMMYEETIKDLQRR